MEVIYTCALEDIFEEVERGVKLHGWPHSYHEAVGILLEELEELKQEIFLKKPAHRSLYKEACQVAAVAVWLMHVAQQRMAQQRMAAEAVDAEASMRAAEGMGIA